MSDEQNGKGDDGGKLLYCSFCGKSQHEVRKLIAGRGVGPRMAVTILSGIPADELAASIQSRTCAVSRRCRGSARRPGSG